MNFEEFRKRAIAEFKEGIQFQNLHDQEDREWARGFRKGIIQSAKFFLPICNNIDLSNLEQEMVALMRRPNKEIKS